MIRDTISSDGHTSSICVISHVVGVQVECFLVVRNCGIKVLLLVRVIALLLFIHRLFLLRGQVFRWLWLWLLLLWFWFLFFPFWLLPWLWWFSLLKVCGEIRDYYLTKSVF